MTGEEYFKDKIDWKFINYLIDKCTEFEDINLETEIDIRTQIKLDTVSIIGVTILNVYRGEYGSDEIYPLMIDSNGLETCIRNYNKYGLVYCLKIPSRKYKDMYNTFYENKLKNRCERVNADRMDSYIVLKPK